MMTINSTGILLNMAKRELGKNPKKAKKTCDIIFEKINSFEELIRLGEMYLELSDYEGVIKCYEKAREINEDTSVLEILAMAYEETLINNPNKGLEHYIGTLYEELGDRTENKEYYEKAIKYYNLTKDKDNPIGYFGLGNIYMSLGDLEKAEKEYEWFLIYEPEDIDGLYNLMLVKEELGKHKEAKEIGYKLLSQEGTTEAIKKEIKEIIKN